MTILSYATVAALLALAVLLVLWGNRIWWPQEREADLAKMVVGTQKAEQMPEPKICYGIAALLVVVALLALSLGGVLPGGGMAVKVLLGVASAAFLLRGLAAYSGPWAKRTPQPAFRAMDRAVYGPLCLAIGFNMIQMVATLA